MTTSSPASTASISSLPDKQDPPARASQIKEDVLTFVNMTPDLNIYTVKELHALAKEAKITGWSRMRKAELIAAIQEAQ